MEIINSNQFQVFVAWDDDPEFWQLTYSQQWCKECRLATKQEIIENTHHFSDPGGFIDSTNDGDILILSDGMFQAVWKEYKDLDGFVENNLYLKDCLGDRTEYLVW